MTDLLNMIFLSNSVVILSKPTVICQVFHEHLLNDRFQHFHSYYIRLTGMCIPFFSFFHLSSSVGVAIFLSVRTILESAEFQVITNASITSIDPSFKTLRCQFQGPMIYKISHFLALTNFCKLFIHSRHEHCSIFGDFPCSPL